MDHTKENQRIKNKFEVEIPASITVFPRTISASATHVYCFHAKKGEIQLFKFPEIAGVVPPAETVFKLTGKQKNLKHLAVKDDGKYLLIVDTSYHAEVFMRTAKGYTFIQDFNALVVAQVRDKNGKIVNAKGLTEHDLTDMDFLEDGSGIINRKAGMVVLWYLRLPNTKYNYSIFLRQHFLMPT